MATLYLNCKTCGMEFASGIAMDEKSFASTQLSNNSHTCPMGHTNSYNKKDYHFKK